MQYELNENVAVLTFDDGKANVVSHDFIDGMNEGLDRAEKEAGAVVIQGRAGMFSGGFDLEEFKKGQEATIALVSRGFEMLTRLYAHPQPLLVACTGHAVAAGAFMLLTADNRVGVEGNFKVTLPETAIGMIFPPVLRELVDSRISNRHKTRVLVQSSVYDPAGAVDAGFLDEVVPADELLEHVIALAKKLTQLPVKMYAQNKRDLRAVSLERMRADIAQ
ncbi:MAG: crotonase/enoyl-CoA hydratase family protein [Halioglobus sp.]